MYILYILYWFKCFFLTVVKKKYDNLYIQRFSRSVICEFRKTIHWKVYFNQISNLKKKMSLFKLEIIYIYFFYNNKSCMFIVHENRNNSVVVHVVCIKHLAIVWNLRPLNNQAMNITLNSNMRSFSYLKLRVIKIEMQTKLKIIYIIKISVDSLFSSLNLICFTIQSGLRVSQDYLSTLGADLRVCQDFNSTLSANFRVSSGFFIV